MIPYFLKKPSNKQTALRRKRPKWLFKGSLFFLSHCKSPGTSKLLVAHIPKKAFFIIESNFAEKRDKSHHEIIQQYEICGNL